MVDVTASISAPATSANTAPFTVTGGGGGAANYAPGSTTKAENPAKWVFIVLAISGGVAVLALVWFFAGGKR